VGRFFARFAGELEHGADSGGLRSSLADFGVSDRKTPTRDASGTIFVTAASTNFGAEFAQFFPPGRLPSLPDGVPFA
jgi:hypothetical protein